MTANQNPWSGSSSVLRFAALADKLAVQSGQRYYSSSPGPGFELLPSSRQKASNSGTKAKQQLTSERSAAHVLSAGSKQPSQADTQALASAASRYWSPANSSGQSTYRTQRARAPGGLLINTLAVPSSGSTKAQLPSPATAASLLQALQEAQSNPRPQSISSGRPQAKGQSAAHAIVGAVPPALRAAADAADAARRVSNQPTYLHGTQRHAFGPHPGCSSAHHPPSPGHTHAKTAGDSSSNELTSEGETSDTDDWDYEKNDQRVALEISNAKSVRAGLQPGVTGLAPRPATVAGGERLVRNGSNGNLGEVGGVQAGTGACVFWGGVKLQRQQSVGSGGHQGTDAMAGGVAGGPRPGTAMSILWRGYDLEDGVLERYQVPCPQSERNVRALKQGSIKGLALRRSDSANSGLLCTEDSANKTTEGSEGSKTARRPSVSRAGPRRPTPSRTTRKTEPYIRVLHPAVIMDPALLHPCANPVAEVPVDEKGRPYPYVLPPTFPGAYPTIAAMGSASAMQAAGLHPLMRTRMLVRYAGIANSPVKTAFREAGWRVTRSAKAKWTVCWGHIFSAEEFAPLHEFQRVNHFPGTWELGRKDYLYRNVSALRRLKGDALDFIPRFYILPRDYDEYRADLDRNPGRLYIQKPTNSSRGRGVRMVTKPSELGRDVKDLLVQHYVDNPYTINGYKFDMRIYVLASCMDPLRVYVYPEGLARFATEQYSDSKADLKKRCVHLTNYSVNKKNQKFVAPGSSCQDSSSNSNSNQRESSSGSGDGSSSTNSAAQAPHASKWSLGALREHIERDRGPGAWQRVWRQVHDIVAGAVLAAETRISTEVKMKVPHRNICFEVWGFDILLDQDLRAWLIEVNTCPSLAADSTLDKQIKTAMVADALHLVGPVPYDHDVYAVSQEAKRQSRLTGLSSGSGAAPAARGPPQVPRTVLEAQELDFRGLACNELPDLVIETEAEYARRRNWERVFPCPSDPSRYLDLFETPRAASIMVCNYLAQKAGGSLQGGAGQGGRPGTTPVTPSGRSRPAINTWRPSGMT